MASARSAVGAHGERRNPARRRGRRSRGLRFQIGRNVADGAGRLDAAVRTSGKSIAVRSSMHGGSYEDAVFVSSFIVRFLDRPEGCRNVPGDESRDQLPDDHGALLDPRRLVGGLHVRHLVFSPVRLVEDDTTTLSQAWPLPLGLSSPAFTRTMVP